MKNSDEKMPNCFRWLRAVRAKIDQETKGMTDEEYCAYIHSSVEEYRKKQHSFISDAGEDSPPSRKAKANSMTIGRRKTPTKPAAGRRKAPKRLAPA